MIVTLLFGKDTEFTICLRGRFVMNKIFAEPFPFQADGPVAENLIGRAFLEQVLPVGPLLRGKNISGSCGDIGRSYYPGIIDTLDTPKAFYIDEFLIIFIKYFS
ncbi:MAG: hypothetical protein HUN04_22790 [Desulfobacter sp.]|nr:MAG: hypothetical protein HUN04_22790 [Desulfobacter sp.]